MFFVNYLHKFKIKTRSIIVFLLQRKITNKLVLFAQLNVFANKLPILIISYKKQELVKISENKSRNNYKKKVQAIKNKKKPNITILIDFFLLSKTNQLLVLLFAAKSFFLLYFFKYMLIKKFHTFIDYLSKKIK
ncbi:hypothetical protein RFI_39957 [Reticulomyxa filosa]|uniref:Transmembrane protein n=1 Tax=Reticulomyxa filosa TaxID=46433 RepID=X6L775_RETFI|nr:hypothetical protein RFI_39957 [Reticulomyxa filosa]|eukprot:ETN97572.1 hypothetical protein RFI_39957 [Reticulomyxa filosa]